MTTIAIGKPVTRIDGLDKITGRERYAADFLPPGTLWAKSLRSPYAHARIRSIDVSRALKHPGVHAVVAGGDLPLIRTGRAFRDFTVLARDAVRFVGERVAAVAAETAAIASEATDLIEVQYEELPAVFDALEALEEGAPVLHDGAGGYEVNLGRGDIHAAMVYPSPNVTSRLLIHRGDLQAGFAQADRVFEHTFHIPAMHQAYLEPHACLVEIDRTGRINVWASNKSPFEMRDDVARVIGVPKERVKVHLLPVGGDFGGKGMHADAAVAYHLAQRTGRPVKLVSTYAEELTASNPRHDAVITLKSGVKIDGEITAYQVRMVFNNGAYAAFRRQVTLPGAENFATCYRIPNVEREILCVYTNTVPRGHMRTPGGVQHVFAAECHFDMIAHELGIDPLEFRLRNVLREGDENTLGRRWQDLLGKETLEAAAKAAGWDTPKAPNVGRGVAIFDRGPRPRASEARVRLDEDGHITLFTGVPECGVGAHTVLQQIVAEAMEVPVSEVTVATGDTDTAPYDGGVGASRVTHTAGGAALAAVRDLKRQLADGARAPVTGSGVYDMNEPMLRTAFCAQVAEVEVDPETGQVRLRRLVNANDVGRVLNPLTLHGQIEGGAIQGMGQALMEELSIEAGVVANPHLGDYKLPTIADIPAIETVLLESDMGELPFQGKHISEQTNVPAAAAIANAVFDAVGVRLFQLPISAEKVYRALKDRQAT